MANWIANATKNAHGQFAAKAKKAGMSTGAFAAKKKNAKGVTGKQARLAAELMGFKKKGADVENAADAKMPGDKKEDMMDAEDMKDHGADENKEKS